MAERGPEMAHVERDLLSAWLFMMFYFVQVFHVYQSKHAKVVEVMEKMTMSV